jgi:hypothetical protein
MHRFRKHDILKIIKASLVNDSKEFIERVKHIDEKVSYKGYRLLRWFSGISIIVAYTNKDNINKLINNKAKNITQETITDEKVILKAQEMLNKILTSDETKKALQDTFNDLFNDSKSQEMMSSFTKASLIKTMDDKTFQNTISNYVWITLKKSVWYK